MTVTTHAPKLYIGTNADRLVFSSAGIAVGANWLESDTGLLFYWTGTAWILSSGGASGGAGGDLFGTYPNPQVTGILGWPFSPPFQGGYFNNSVIYFDTTTTPNTWNASPIAGDVSGTNGVSLTTVLGLKGRPLDSTLPSTGQAYVYDSVAATWLLKTVPPIGSAFVTIGNDATLTGERALTGTANQIVVTDGGANGNVTLSTPQNIDTAAAVQFGKLALGQAPGANMLDVSTPTSASRVATFNYFANDALTFIAAMQKSRGATVGAHTVVQSGDAVFSFQGNGSDGAGFFPAGRIRMLVDASPTTGIVPGRIVFETTSPSASSLEAMRIDSAQRVTIGGVANQYGHNFEVHGVTNRTLSLTWWGGAVTSSALITGLKSRGSTVGTQTAVVTGDSILSITGQGSDGTGFIVAAQVLVSAEGTIATGAVPGRITFSTANASGTLTEVMRIDSAGLITIGGVANQAGDSVEAHALGQSAFSITEWANIAGGSSFVGRHSRGTTVGTHSAVLANDKLGSFLGVGSDGTVFRNAGQFRIEADANASSGVMPGRVVFLTSATNVMVEAMRIDSKQNVIVSTAALATTATDGFLYIPTCAGAPTGTPTAYTGRVPMVYDTTNNKLYVYNAAWKGVTLA